jgi:GNAT superfamily N-acetyltransferase
MTKVEVVKVTEKRHLDDFVHFTRRHYAGCNQYVPYMEADIRNMFNKRKNSATEFALLQPFIAYNQDVPVGRIVGIINSHANEKWHTKNVRFALIEFIDDLAVSKALLEAVSAWGHEHGMTHIQGPLGITDFDKEGMLVEDFDLEGSMSSIYNYEYYPRHMEQLGFEKEVDWLQIRIQIPEDIPARYSRVSQYAREQMGLSVRKLSLKEMKDGYVKKLFDLLNTAYSPIFGFTEMTDQQVAEFADQYLPVLNLDMVPVVENQEGEVVGVAVTMPSLADALRKSGGRLWPTGWFHLLGGLKWKRSDMAEMLLVAVRPDYQGLGVNAMFFDDLIPVYHKYGIHRAETGPQLEDNVRELSQWKPLHPEFVKRRRCYVKNILP